MSSTKCPNTKVYPNFCDVKKGIYEVKIPTNFQTDRKILTYAVEKLILRVRHVSKNKKKEISTNPLATKVLLFEGGGGRKSSL